MSEPHADVSWSRPSSQAHNEEETEAINLVYTTPYVMVYTQMSPQSLLHSSAGPWK